MSRELEPFHARVEKAATEKALAAASRRARRILAAVWTVLWMAAPAVAADEQKPEPSTAEADAEEPAKGVSESALILAVMPLLSEGARNSQARVVPLEPLPLLEVAAPVLENPVSESQVAVIETLVLDWATAWSRQRIGDYLTFYSSGFLPASGLTRQQWARARNQRLSAPAFIRVELDSLEVRVLDGHRARVQFVQAYTSNSYHDVVTKMLELANEEDGWKIVEEAVIPAESATMAER